MRKETTAKTLMVAAILSVVCSIALAATVTLLKPIQTVNKSLEKQRRILEAASLMPAGKVSAQEVRDIFATLERYLVDLETGKFEPISLDDPFDLEKATKDTARSIALTPEQDIAKIRRRANQVDVYVLRNEAGKLKELILPVSGYGLWGPMHGYLVLHDDSNTVAGITFTAHAETPGLGGEIDNPRWKALWAGKKLYGDDGEVALNVRKGVDNNKPEAIYQIDALSGATLTSNGVTHMLQFWGDDLGYRKFLDNVRNGGL